MRDRSKSKEVWLLVEQGDEDEVTERLKMCWSWETTSRATRAMRSRYRAWADRPWDVEK